jgi:hypothetical protein
MFWRGVRIVLSPESSDELEKASARRFLESAVGAEIEVAGSRVPLRNVAA